MIYMAAYSIKNSVFILLQILIDSEQKNKHLHFCIEKSNEI